MPLTNDQISRYSRQIVVPKWGGRAQQRVLGARLLLIAAPEDFAQPLAYMVGAGVGEIDLCVRESDRALKSICDRMRALNPDSTVTYGNIAQVPDVTLALAGSASVLEFIANEAPPASPAVFARLDAPGKIAILPAPPPCLRCADADLFVTFGPRSDSAAFVAMVATTEALKLVAGFDPATAPSIVEFQGFESKAMPLQRAATRCVCSDRARA